MSRLISAATPSSARLVACTLRRSRGPSVRVGETLYERKHHERADDERDQGKAENPIPQALPARRGEIFVHSQRPDVADAAPVEIARGRVVHGVGMPPGIVWRESQHARDDPEYIIGPRRFEERTVTAIVEEDEDADQEACGHDCQRQREPV